MTHSASDGSVPVVPIPEIRDYQRINAELVRHLNARQGKVRLVGAEGQRLLVAGLAGEWNAVVEVEGRAGPEFTADLDAPGLTVICHGPVADGAARGLRAGRVVVLGDAGAALGYMQEGGIVVAAQGVGPRRLESARRRARDPGSGRPSGGRTAEGGAPFAYAACLGPHAGRGWRGGRLVRLASEGDGLAGVADEDAETFRSLWRDLASWVRPGPH